MRPRAHEDDTFTLQCEAHREFSAVACPRCLDGVEYPFRERRLAIVAEARSFLGVKFRHRGRDRNGIDCVGVIMSSAPAGDCAPNVFDDYPEGARGEYVLERAAERLDVIEPTDALPADVLAFSIRGFPAHFGIVTEAGGLIHARWKRDVLEHRIDDRWTRRIARAFRFREFSDNG